MSATTALVPPRRLGALLCRARTTASLELRDLIQPSGLSEVELDDIEHGRRDLDEMTLAALMYAYGIDGKELVPQRARLTIDLNEGRISASRSGLGVDEVSGPDAVLARYLALVYRLRGLPVGAPLHLRDLDIDVLGTALRLDTADVSGRLDRLMSEEIDIDRDQRRIRRQLVLPLVGVVVAATGLGTLVLVTRDAPPATPTDTVVAADRAATRIATEIGDAATESNPGN